MRIIDVSKYLPIVDISRLVGFTRQAVRKAVEEERLKDWYKIGRNTYLLNITESKAYFRKSRYAKKK